MLYIVELYYKKDGYIYEEDVFFTTRKAEAEKKYAELKAGTPGIYVIDKARLTVPKDRDAKEFFDQYIDDHEGEYPSLGRYMPDDDWEPYEELFEASDEDEA